jgi:hypothetical protein
LGMEDLDELLRVRPSSMRSLSPETWDQLAAARGGGAFDVEFHAAWENGRAFLQAADGLRGRLPQAVEWKGSLRASGDEVTPVDLRIDHVYLVSCKYLSNILFNVAPSHVFDALLVGGTGRGGAPGGDWYAEVAPAQYQALYEAVREGLSVEGAGGAGTRAGVRRSGNGSRGTSPSLFGPDGGGDETAVPVHSVAALGDLPARAIDLTSEQRAALSARLKSGWPAQAKEAYRSLSEEVARQSAARWLDALGRGAGAGEAMLWRLLRIGSAPYFVLGSSATQSLRLRIATPWDWRQQYALSRFEVFPQSGGQPRVGWQAVVRDRSSGEVSEVNGHIEIRWSHGRFGGYPEAKGYLDTRHQLVPGYFPLR